MGIEMQTPLYVKITTLVGGGLVVFLLAGWELVNRWISRAVKSISGSLRTEKKRPLRPA